MLSIYLLHAADVTMWFFFKYFQSIVKMNKAADAEMIQQELSEEEIQQIAGKMV